MRKGFLVLGLLLTPSLFGVTGSPLERAAAVYVQVGCNKPWLARLTARWAARRGLPASVVAAQIFLESSCRPTAVSKDGSVGLMQVNLRFWGDLYHVTANDMLDPEKSLAVGTSILKRFVQRYGLWDGVRHYNGSGPRAEKYARRVLALAGYVAMVCGKPLILVSSHLAVWGNACGHPLAPSSTGPTILESVEKSEDTRGGSMLQVGVRIRELRKAKGLSQGEIEVRTGLLRCYTSRVENGHTVPAVATLEKFAAALGVETYELLRGGKPTATVKAQTLEGQRLLDAFATIKSTKVRGQLIVLAEALAGHI